MLWLALVALVRAQKPHTVFLNRTVSIGGTVYRYQIYVPYLLDKPKRWPVLFFLHGAGERGDDGLLETDEGIGHAIRQQAEKFQFIVVMPQCWKDKLWTQADMQAQEFHGDRDRVYLTGLSMGGYGTWDLAAKHPGKFAALVVICGGIYGPPHFRQLHIAIVDDPNIQDAYAATASRIEKPLSGFSTVPRTTPSLPRNPARWWKCCALRTAT